MDENDIQLVEMLAGLAEENEVRSNVDNDSVLGSQYSAFSEPARNLDLEDLEEEEVEDLNITSLDLDNLSSWESVCKESDQRDNLLEATLNEQNIESANDSHVSEENCKDVTLTDFSQFDGVDDLYENTLEYERECVNCSSNEIDTPCCTVTKETRCLKKDEGRVARNKKIEEESCVARYQLQSDHRDLDVYDVDEIEEFETLELIDQCCNEKKCEPDLKSRVQGRNLKHYKPSKFSTKFPPLNVDGATVTDSSDSELEIDLTIDREEKRICTYTAQSVVTPKKRKLYLNNDQESPGKRTNTTVKTPRRRYNSPAKTLRSPQLSGNYSPLDIIITSPKINRTPTSRCEVSPKRKQYVPMSDVPSTSTTPKRKAHPLRVSLLRDKRIMNPNVDLGN